jgi:hypothetical protein
MFMSKFGNLSVGGGGETDTGVEAGSGSGEADDVFKSMDAECGVHARNQGETSSAHQVGRKPRLQASTTGKLLVQKDTGQLAFHALPILG